MLSRKIFSFLILFFFCFSSRLCAQIPAHLKTPYWDLVKLNNARQYQSAILQGKILIAQEPKFPYAYGQLALAFEKTDHVAQGLAYFDSLRQQSPDNPYVYYALAMLEKNRKNFEPAVGNMKVCIKLDPAFAQAYRQLANIYNEKKDLATAASYFYALRQEDSLNAAVHFGIGCVYQLKNELAKGAEAFARSLALDSELTYAYYLKGLMHVFQGDYPNAIAAWTKGVEIAAKLKELQLQAGMTSIVGSAYQDLGEWQKSIPYRLQAIELTHVTGDQWQEARHLSNLSGTYYDLGRFNEALKCLQRAWRITQDIGDKEFQEEVIGFISAVLSSQGEYKSGVDSAAKAIKLAEARGDSGKLAAYCDNLGANYAGLAEYKKALHSYQRGLAIRRQNGDTRNIINLLINIGNVHIDTGAVQLALENYTEALKIAQEIAHKPFEAQALGSLGYAYSAWSDYTTAYNYLQQALKISEEVGDEIARGTYLGNLGGIHKKWGNFPKAMTSLREALVIHKRIGYLRGIVEHYDTIAGVHEIRGDYLAALDSCRKALKVSQVMGARDLTSNLLAHIGNLYKALGDLEEASKYLQQAQKLSNTIGLKKAELGILADLGRIYEARQADDKADTSFRKSLNVARAIGYKEGVVEALMALGDLQAKRQNYPLALKKYDEALAQAIGQKEQEGRLYLNLGSVHLQQNDLTKALAFFQKALAIGKKMNAFELIYESQSSLAATAEKQQRYDDALKYYAQAIDGIESVRERLKIESYRTQFIESKLEIYESVITLLIRLGRFEEAFNYLQRFRARSFLEIFSPEHRNLAEGISPRYRFWEQKLREIYDRLRYEYSKGESKRNEKLIAALNDSLQQSRREHEKAADEIRLTRARDAELLGIAPPLGLREIQQKLLPRQKLVEYFAGPEMVAAYVIQADTFHCEVLKVKREELEDWIGRLRAPFKQVKEGTIRNLADVPFDIKLAQQLYEKLFQPLEKYLAPNTSLLIVPDGVLHYLPFEALVTGVENKRFDANVTFSRYENVHYLIEKFAITYLPAASLLALEKSSCDHTNKTANLLFGIGSPDFGRFTDSSAMNIRLKASKGLIFAPLSDRDVQEVKQIMQPASVFIGKEAQEERFKNEAKNFAHVYLSTHAIVDESQPMYSLIAFTQDDDPQEDGFLHAYEIFNLCFKANLITLSACETGLGKLSRGEGLIGLTRGFLYAGAASVLVSLWSVDESTAALMKIFYQNLKAGMSKAEALRQAKLKLLRTRENGVSFSHPFLWAPFVLVGEGT